jgi:hypothetical protein
MGIEVGSIDYIYSMKVDRKIISSVSMEESESQLFSDSLKMTPQDRFAQITYLRESFYGTEATTGRLQRIFEVAQRK